jgi:hypothetical protein
MERTCKICNTPKEIENFSTHKRFTASDYICCSCKTQSRRSYRNKHNKHIRKQINKYCREYQRRGRRELKDFVIIDNLHRSTGLSQYDIKKHPKLIEAKRVQMIIKRIVNESNL